MPFVKWRSAEPYATGAIRFSLGPKAFASKLMRHKVLARADKTGVAIMHAGQEWRIDDWERMGDGYVAWIRPVFNACASDLSRRLALSGVRHMIEHSRPRDEERDDIRVVTRYEYRWAGHATADAADTTPVVTFYEEHL